MGKKRVAATLRERQVFAALMEEFMRLMPGQYMPQFESALTKFKAGVSRMEDRERMEQEQFDKAYGHEDYRG